MRCAFRLSVRPECLAAYDKAHTRVWPELLEVIRAAGISNYSIFRRGIDLFFYMEVDDFERAWSEIEKSDVNARWQKEMAPYFAPVGVEPNERFPMMREVFYLA
jgi:L-rhamnose mutarotase